MKRRFTWDAWDYDCTGEAYIIAKDQCPNVANVPNYICEVDDIDPACKSEMQVEEGWCKFQVRTDGEAFKLRPGQFALATTMERIDLPRELAAFVQGRSSIGRAGLTVQNAGFIDPGFHGHITLELKNETRNTIIIRPGYPVAQIVFEEARGVETMYNGKYNNQVDATGSRMELDQIDC